MKRTLPVLTLLIAVLLLPSCGGGGEGGDNMNDYWVSAARFANGTKSIKLYGGMGSVVISSRESINIGPDRPNDVETEATTTGLITGEMTTYDMPYTSTFLASGTTYTTDPENKTAVLTVRTLEQPSAGTQEREATTMLVQLLGAPGRYVSPSGSKTYFQIDSEVEFRLDFNTGTWSVSGSTSQPNNLGGQGRFTVVAAY